MIEPIIMNKNFERLAVIDDYSSLIWTSRYYTCGDFEIVVPLTPKYLELMQIGFYIVRDDDENTGIIEDLEINVDEDNKTQFIVTGRFLPSILARRIVAEQTQLYGTIQTGITKLINENAINPKIAARKIPNLTIKNESFTERLDAQYTGKNLLEVIEDICKTNGIGFNIVLKDKKFQFSLYKGTNRSYSQNANPRVIFSDEYDNLLSSCYISQSSSLVTDVLVAGEGEGLDRKTLWVSNVSNTGLDRYEMYQDQRDLSTNDGQITDEEYNAQLKQAGLENITQITSEFEGTVYFGNIKYKTDVNLGDIVTVENKKWGIHVDTRLIEVIESVDETGNYEVLPTFGI